MIAGIARSLTDLFAPWEAVYSDSVALSTTVTTVHIVSLLVAGGLAIGADRATLRALRGTTGERQHQLSELHDVHRPVLIALSFLLVSGLMLATADLETFFGSWLFWVKLSLVALLLINGAILHHAGTRLLREPERNLAGRLRVSSRISLTLWIATAIAGTVLTNV